MKLDFATLNQDIFKARLGKVGEHNVYLVEPGYSGGSEKWTKETLHLRSSMWDTDGNLVSAGFPKFFNLFIGEDGEMRAEHKLAPLPKTLKGWTLMDKKDGSLLIMSKYKGQLIIRTRGTFDYSTLSNAEEMEYLRETYPLVFSYFDNVETGSYSVLFEWYSPKNKIIINYGDYPKLWLIGIINHANYSFASQKELDEVANFIQVERPESYQLDNVEDARKAVEAMVGREGFVMYPPNGQNPEKIKSPRYWALHALKEDVSNIEKVLDIWLSVENPTFQSVYQFLFDKYDFELAEYCRHFISKLADTSKEVERMMAGFVSFLTTNNLFTATDKDAYAKITEAYGKTNRAGYLMNIKKGKPISKEGIKKLFLQVLKK